MNKKIWIIGVIFGILAVGIVCAVVGYQMGIKKADSENSSTPAVKEEIDTFYAKIIESKQDSFLVEGLEVNDINHRGRFYFSLKKDVELLWRNEVITISELETGDTISITYTGEVLESYPATLTKVLKIQLLDDEK